jgi:hypothetical protein
MNTGQRFADAEPTVPIVTLSAACDAGDSRNEKPNAKMQAIR